jgi:hypothetical protein
VTIGYQEIQRWSWGFVGKITISGLSASQAKNWRLGFGYPGEHILGVQGAYWQSTSAYAGIASAVNGRQGDGGGYGGTGPSGAPGDSGANGTAPGQPGTNGTAPGQPGANGSWQVGTASSGGTSAATQAGASAATKAGASAATKAGASARTVTITVTVQGRPTAPSGCVFDGTVCSISEPGSP